MERELPLADLTVRELEKTFVNVYTREQVQALANVSLDIADGEFVSVVGASGSGKTTLLNVVAGFIPPTRGEILVGEQPVKRPGRDRGVVFQSHALFPWKTVLDNVAFGPKMAGASKDERERIAREYTALVGLSGAEARYPHELSGGMQQRVGVARALANEPQVLLMDEPFASVDAQTRLTLQEELLHVWEAKRPTVLFITHDVDEAVFLSDRVVVLGGRPSTIVEIVTVDLSRPREWSKLVEDSRFKGLVARVLSLVRANPSAPAAERTAI
jgi:NitT/TauT family transport system ATP-binding protein